MVQPSRKVKQERKRGSSKELDKNEEQKKRRLYDEIQTPRRETVAIALHENSLHKNVNPESANKALKIENGALKVENKVLKENDCQQSGQILDLILEKARQEKEIRKYAERLGISFETLIGMGTGGTDVEMAHFRQ